MDIRTLTVDAILEALKIGIKFNGCDWTLSIDDLRVDDQGQVVAENGKWGRPNGYYATLVTQCRQPGDTPYRGLMHVEADRGRNKIGDVVVELRLNTNTGRYMVHVETEQVFDTPEEFEYLPRATRSSLENPRQALRRRAVDLPNGIRSNPRRIIGKHIEQHVLWPGWGPNLDVTEFMDVFDYVHETGDAMGHSTLLRALQTMPAAIADEVYRQMRDPDRCKK